MCLVWEAGCGGPVFRFLPSRKGTDLPPSVDTYESLSDLEYGSKWGSKIASRSIAYCLGRYNMSNKTKVATIYVATLILSGML
ncbi:hypothetical protein E2C01_009438 [Portunus trituberculatus]|uniref:Uncharacterized protein n=1 Tax=Portunus trituberculatus TaxID=210409 RepID=A0A5B7D4H4_PORTR|nr:hypothetical protein [Portunus trituberculatus]